MGLDKPPQVRLRETQMREVFGYQNLHEYLYCSDDTRVHKCKAKRIWPMHWNIMKNDGVA